MTEYGDIPFFGLILMDLQLIPAFLAGILLPS